MGEGDGGEDGWEPSMTAAGGGGRHLEDRLRAFDKDL